MRGWWGGGNRDWQRQHELRRLVTYRDAYVKTRTSIGEKEIFVEDIFEKKNVETFVATLK